MDGFAMPGRLPTIAALSLAVDFFYFLAEPDVLNLLRAITGLVAPGSWLGLDVVNEEMLTSPSTRHWNERMTAVGVPWLFTRQRPAAATGRHRLRK